MLYIPQGKRVSPITAPARESFKALRQEGVTQVEGTGFESSEYEGGNTRMLRQPEFSRQSPGEETADQTGNRGDKEHAQELTQGWGIVCVPTKRGKNLIIQEILGRIFRYFLSFGSSVSPRLKTVLTTPREM